jgi:hypothetical protein
MPSNHHQHLLGMMQSRSVQGPRSLRSGVAMSLYLAMCNDAELLAGQWNSNAFMRYLCLQLTDSFVDLSGKMTPNYHTIATQEESPAAWEQDPAFHQPEQPEMRQYFNGLDQTLLLMHYPWSQSNSRQAWTLAVAIILTTGWSWDRLRPAIPTLS